MRRSSDGDRSARASLCRAGGRPREATYARAGARPLPAGLLAQDWIHRRRDAAAGFRPKPGYPQGWRATFLHRNHVLHPLGWSGDHVLADSLAGGPIRCVAGVEHSVRQG